MTYATAKQTLPAALPWILMWFLAPAPLYIWAILAWMI